MQVLLSLAMTAHLGLFGDYNNIHPHVRVEFDNTMVVGSFYNSEEAIGVYIAKNFISDEGYFIDLGVVSGYDTVDAPVIPFVRAGKKLNKNYTIFVAPAVEVYDNKTIVGGVIGLEYSIPLN